MKKRISIFTTAALCITVGSVYATWTYAQNAANSLENISIGKTLETAETVEKGDIVLINNTLNLIVDKATDSYKAVLTVEGSLTVAFEPHELATSDTIALEFVISGTNLKYNELDIFVLPQEAIALNKNNTWTIDGSNLGITMGNIELPTYADYEEFKTAFDALELTITFSEIPESSNN